MRVHWSRCSEKKFSAGYVCLVGITTVTVATVSRSDRSPSCLGVQEFIEIFFLPETINAHIKNSETARIMLHFSGLFTIN